MNIQRDINPENEKKLNKMLDEKFGKRSKTIVTGESVRGAQMLLKRVIKARKQFEDTVFNKPQDKKVSKRRVGKHGSHDQSSHGKGRSGSQADRDWANITQGKPIEGEYASRHEADNPNYPPKSRSKRPQGPYSRKVAKRKVGKHGSHDQSTHGKGRGGAARRQPETKAPKQRSDWTPDFPTTAVDRVSSFANKYPKSWHSFSQDKKTQDAVEASASRGDIEISRETKQFRLKRQKKVTKRGVSKHGQHDQRTHSPTGRAAVQRERGAKSPTPSKVRMRVAGRKVREAGEAISPGATARAGRAIRAKLNPKVILPKIDDVLDEIDAGTRIYRRLKELRQQFKDLFDTKKFMKAKMSPEEIAEAKRLAEDLKGKESVDNPHALARWQVQHKVNKSIEKGISHSLEILTNAIRLIGVQEADKKISESDEKKLQDLIDEVLGVAGYLDTVKEQGYFEKAVVRKHPGHADQGAHGRKGEEPRTIGEGLGARRVDYKGVRYGYSDGKWLNLDRSRPGKPIEAEKKTSQILSSHATRRHKVSKGEAAVPDSSATDRPSFTTPAVAGEQKRQNIKPNAKGRGESTARVAGY